MNYKKPRRLCGVLKVVAETSLDCLGAASGKASLAEHRAATLLNGARLERNLASSTALSTHCIVHLAWSGCALSLALVAAVLAALWSAQALACIEFLFTRGEREGLTAIAAL